jgi:signal transduction histidine kinase/HAMP domain-containing protein
MEVAGSTETKGHARSPLARRVLASFAVVVVAFAVTVAVGLWAQRRSGQDVAALSLGYLPLETALASARATQWTVAARLDRLLEDPSAAGTTREWLETVARGRPAVLARAKAAAGKVLGESPDEATRAFGRDVAAEIDEIDRDLAEGARALPDLFGALSAGDHFRAQEHLRAITTHERSAAQRLDVLAEKIADRRQAVVTGSVARDKRAIALSVGLALFSLIVAAVATRQMRRRLSPLAPLTARAQAIAAGDRSPLAVELLQEGERGAPRDEIGELAVAFAAMVEGVATRDADLLRLRRRQEDIVNHLRAAVIALREDGSVEAANPAAQKLFGVQIGDRLGESSPPLWDLVSPDVAHAIGKGVEPPARAGVTLPRADEAPLVVDLRVVPMRFDEADARRLALLVADDVSDAAAARQRALQAERLAAIGKMAAHITHEIRNPLSSIGLNVELLDETIAKAGKGSTQEARQLLSAIAREVGRLADVSEDYLRVARLPSPRPAPVDLAKLLRDVVVFARPELDRARVAVDLRLPGTSVIVAVDEAQVRQALLNLVRNAREAMEDGGKLTIDLALDDVRATLQVIDEGPGIDEALQGRIFDPFFTTKSTGTGLGLPLTKQILEAHGGSIAYAPETPHGSRFILTFPLGRTERASAA